MALQVGFASLGNMGRNMAWKMLTVVDKAKPLRVWNRTKAKCEPFANAGCVVEDTFYDLATTCNIIFSFEFDSAAYKSFGEDIIKAKKAQGEDAKIKIWVSMATVSHLLVKEMTVEFEANGLQLISCPILGRPPAIEAGLAVALLAGPESATKVARPYIESGTKAIIDIGFEPYLANVQKLVGNFFVLTMAEQLAEGYCLAEKVGLSKENVHKMLSHFMPAPAFQGYSTAMAKEDFILKSDGFPIAGGLKDANLIKSLADEGHAAVPILDSTLSHLQEMKSRNDYDNCDLNALALFLRDKKPSS